MSVLLSHPNKLLITLTQLSLSLTTRIEFSMKRFFCRMRKR